MTIEVGASLELELSKIVTAGVEASVAITTETGKVQGVQANCPDGPWTCSLIIHPTVVTVTGLQTDQDAMCKKLGPGKPYTVQFPVKVCFSLMLFLPFFCSGKWLHLDGCLRVLRFLGTG